MRSLLFSSLPRTIGGIPLAAGRPVSLVNWDWTAPSNRADAPRKDRQESSRHLLFDGHGSLPLFGEFAGGREQSLAATSPAALVQKSTMTVGLKSQLLRSKPTVCCWKPLMPGIRAFTVTRYDPGTNKTGLDTVPYSR